jgi:CRP-like cAMP-binding protein
MRSAEKNAALLPMEANGLLATLPPVAMRLLSPHLERVPVPFRKVLVQEGQLPRHVYFPLTGVMSMVVVMKDSDDVVEIATIGNEGLVGAPIVLGTLAMNHRVFCQVGPGEALRLESKIFAEALEQSAVIRLMCNRYIQAMMVMMGQGVACNRVHPVEQRCARWILMTADRAPSNRFNLTQEFLAQMLGVRRATVTVAAGMLQQAGIIRYRRGIIEVADRPQLEAACCECYGVIKSEFARLLSPAGGAAPTSRSAGVSASS